MKFSSKSISAILVVTTTAHGLGALRINTKSRDVDDDETLSTRSLESDYELWSRDFQEQAIVGMMRRNGETIEHEPSKQCKICGGEVTNPHADQCNGCLSSCAGCETNGRFPANAVTNVEAGLCNACLAVSAPVDAEGHGNTGSAVIPAGSEIRCPLCLKLLRSSFERHKSACKGTPDKYIFCPNTHCGHVYIAKGKLTRHKKNCKLGDLSNVSIPAASIPDPELVKPQILGDKQIKCRICRKTGRQVIFEEPEEFNQHFAQEHNPITNTCLLCGKRLTRASYLQKHMEKIHGTG